MTRSNIALVAVALAAIALCLVFIVFGLANLPDVSMGMHGWIALGVGTAFSVLLGGGLAAILIISRRHGYDEAAHEVFKESEPDR